MPERPIENSSSVDVPDLTVIVCTYNRVDRLPACLRALSQQTIASRVQVIVVDDGSEQDTAAVVRDFPVEFVALGENQGLSAARNAGLAYARSELVAFTDDDVIVPSTWCAQLVDLWSSAPATTQALGGVVTVAEVTSLTQRYLVRHNPLAPIELDVAHAQGVMDRLRAYLRSQSDRRPEVRPVYSLVGANMSFRRSALAVVGDFDPTIRFGGDEELVCVNLRRHFGDESVICTSSLVVAHSFDPRLTDTLRRAYLYGVSNGRSFARHGGVPSVRPIGGLFTALLVVVSPWSLLWGVTLAVLTPFVMWRRWVRDAVRERRLEVALYPLLALAQEIGSNVGVVVGWRQEVRRRATEGA